MTQITLASKDSTPQVHGPFHVTHTDLGANYAAGFPLFTPTSGEFVLAAWALETVAWVGDGLICDDNVNISVSLQVETGSTSSNTAPGISGGAQIRAHLGGGTGGYSAGEADLYFLVVPVAA